MERAKAVVSGTLSEEAYVRLVGEIAEEEVRQDLQDFRWQLFDSPEAKEMDDVLAASGVPPTRIEDLALRLHFEPEQLAWAVRYQVGGEDFEDIARKKQDSTAIRKIVKEILLAVGLTPRRKPGRPHKAKRITRRK
jgi:hypothetical protein